MDENLWFITEENSYQRAISSFIRNNCSLTPRLHCAAVSRHEDMRLIRLVAAMHPWPVVLKDLVDDRLILDTGNHFNSTSALQANRHIDVA